MPHRTFDIEEVGRYLHLGRADVQRLVKNQDIPFERHGERIVFRKVEVDAWASQRILGLEGRRLAEYHQKTSSGTRRFLAHEAMMPELMLPGYVEPALPAKTKASVLRQMTALAEKTGRVCDAQGLLAGLEAREALCSTGVPGGLALLHSRFADTYMFDSPFIVLGRTVQAIPFGAPDGAATDLFFLLGSPDDRLHLHTLARLCLMAQKTNLPARLRDAPDAASMRQSILEAEQAVLGSKTASRT
ncbi:MAG: PTS sugar transporter subunit IIA [Limisphaerales bacterium]